MAPGHFLITQYRSRTLETCGDNDVILSAAVAIWPVRCSSSSSRVDDI